LHERNSKVNDYTNNKVLRNIKKNHKSEHMDNTSVSSNCDTRTAYKIVSVYLKKQCIFVRNMLVPKLTFMYRSGLYRYFVCTKSDCTDIDIQCTKTGCTEKYVPNVYVPKLSCTESDLPLNMESFSILKMVYKWAVYCSGAWNTLNREK